MIVDGPLFEDLSPGQVLDPAPAITIGPGEAAMYQAICGDPLRLPLGATLSEQVTGRPGMVNPALVLHVSIGQSTVATRRVVANLFYRGVRVLRPVWVGDTLQTWVEIRAMAEATRRPDRPLRGKVVLGITTVTSDGHLVADYERCALLPLRDTAETGHADDIGEPGGPLDLESYDGIVPKWNLSPLSGLAVPWPVGSTREDPMRDHVSDAVALVRLTQNQAFVHRDATLGPGGRRLVYGGHTIGLAQASLSRLVPAAATVLGWESCDHTGPVFEGDLLSFAHTLEADRVLPSGGRLLAVRTIVHAERDGEQVPVLDWRPVVLSA
ncbi:MAG: hypothetical protein KDB21_05295 [Acidimicrobiales bacterium]|nr:hypothetical protein [Acidimicrobiales bacterium]